MNTRILVIEHDPHIVALLREHLRRDGHIVISAGNGREGLGLTRNARPDLVILDQSLPDMDGFEACRILRSESSVLAMMLTEWNNDKDRLFGLDSGADDCVTKPISPREVGARVRSLLRRRSHRNR